MGVLAIFGAAVLFAAGYHFLLGKEGIGMRYVRLTGTLIFGSVPLYLEHLFLNLIRAWGGQMAVFSGYVECKGHSVLQ